MFSPIIPPPPFFFYDNNTYNASFYISLLVTRVSELILLSAVNVRRCSCGGHVFQPEPVSLGAIAGDSGEEKWKGGAMGYSFQGET